MHELVEILTVMFMAAFKFLFSGLVALKLGFSVLETFVLTSIGGIVGAIAFYLLAKRVLEWFRARYLRKRAARISKGQVAVRIFTRTNRTIVRIKRRWGMIGFVVLTPPVLSIPISAVLAAKYFKHDRRTLPALIGSIVVWSAFLTTVWSFL